MTITQADVSSIEAHIEKLTRIDQVETLSRFLNIFEPNLEMETIGRKLNQRKEFLDDMAAQYRVMP